MATACSEPPLGRQSWTMQLLAERLVELNLVEKISDETVRRTLKKTRLNQGLKNNGVFQLVEQNLSPKMEQVLDLYEKPYDRDLPQICFDERPCQLIGENPIPIPAEPGQPERYDYEYIREGTCNLFAFFQPKTGSLTHQSNPSKNGC